MRPNMPKGVLQLDVLVLGDHPAAYLAAALLRNKSKLRILHATIPGEQLLDRLVLINPRLFELHPLLEPLRRKLDTRGIYGLRFLADDPAMHSEFRSKSAVACVGRLRDVRDAMRGVAAAQGVEFVAPKLLQIRRIDEHGIQIDLASQCAHPKALVLAGRLASEQERILGLPDEWEHGVLRRYSYVRLKGVRMADLGARPQAPMSLDLHGLLFWAWLLPGPRHTQLCIDQPLNGVPNHAPVELLNHWSTVLYRHGVFKAPVPITPKMVESVNLPLGGALAHEGLANRTLLVGPAGGFYSASGEDVFPNCWSALFAADILKKALHEPHLQDALHPYRHEWRTTLGDYLRGPQQNLRFLLSLVYRNQIMTNRLAEAILTGASVVR
jgi:hypothetical protein